MECIIWRNRGNYGQLIVYAENLNSYCTTAKSFDEFLLDILNNNFYDMFKSIGNSGNLSHDVSDEYDDLEEAKEDGMWQVAILARLKSDSKKGFALGELMMKTHNQMANKELSDHIFFEGFEYLGHESEVKGFVGKEEGLSVFEVILGS